MGRGEEDWGRVQMTAHRPNLLGLFHQTKPTVPKAIPCFSPIKQLVALDETSLIFAIMSVLEATGSFLDLLELLETAG